MPNSFVVNTATTSQEMSRLAGAIDGSYYINGTGGAVTPSSGMVLAVSAITASNVVANSVTGTIAYAGSTVTVSTADPTNPRRDWVYYDVSDGSCGVTAGTPVASTATTGPVLPNLTASRIGLAEIAVGAGVTTIASGNISDRRAANGSLPADPFTALADAFGSGGYRQLGIVGGGQPVTLSGSSLSSIGSGGVPIGVGFFLQLGTTSGTLDVGTAASTVAGMSSLNTGATSGQKATIVAETYGWASATANGADLRCTIALDANANRNVFFGIKTSNNASDENTLIGFRVVGNGNIFGVSDNAGTETTRDSGFAGNATPVVYRLRMTVNAGTVKFYINDTQVGADVSTNVPAFGSSTASFLVLGVVNSTTANAPLYFRDVFTRVK